MYLLSSSATTGVQVVAGLGSQAAVSNGKHRQSIPDYGTNSVSQCIFGLAVVVFLPSTYGERGTGTPGLRL